MSSLIDETYEVQIQRHPETRRIVSRRVLMNGFLHNEDGPAIEEFDAVTGGLTRTEYYINGDRHCVGGAALSVWDGETGALLVECFAERGSYHRLGGEPAVRHFAKETGEATMIKFYQRGSLHRIDGPAFVKLDAETGVITFEEWRIAGKLHRGDGGPASFDRDPQSGVTTMEEYFYYGERHRGDGPALTERDAKTGEVVNLQYWRNGVHLPAVDQGLEDAPQP